MVKVLSCLPLLVNNVSWWTDIEPRCRDIEDDSIDSHSCAQTANHIPVPDRRVAVIAESRTRGWNLVREIPTVE